MLSEEKRDTGTLCSFTSKNPPVHGRIGLRWNDFHRLSFTAPMMGTHFLPIFSCFLFPFFPLFVTYHTPMMPLTKASSSRSTFFVVFRSTCQLIGRLIAKFPSSSFLFLFALLLSSGPKPSIKYLQIGSPHTMVRPSTDCFKTHGEVRLGKKININLFGCGWPSVGSSYSSLISSCWGLIISKTKKRERKRDQKKIIFSSSSSL